MPGGTAGCRAFVIAIRDAAAADEGAWRRLWRDYVTFYGADVPAAVTAATWHRVLDGDTALICRLAEVDGSIAGFSVCVLHGGTWTIAPVCYLEDLFVDPTARGRGVGTALITDLIDRGKALGWSRLYWHTRGSNATARRLYDKFASADDFVRYRLFLD